MNPRSNVLEYEFTCPHCWERITMLLEPASSGWPGHQTAEQSYIEDCEICCNPIRITYVLRAGEVETFNARSIGQ